MIASAAPKPAPAVAQSGARLLISTLERLGVGVVFGYPGGAIMPVYDALAGSKLKHILVRHEQGAAFAADAYARASGRVGVCIATSGPGATNLVTGIANAMMDSVPMVCITGNVAQGVMGTDAFQEIDILGVTLPIVKHSILVRDPADVPAAVEEAFHIAAAGRPGPVLIDMPKDVQVGTTTAPRGFSVPNISAGVDDDAVAAAEAAIRAARRPLIYVGGGVKIARAAELLRAFVRATGIPQVATLNALGTIPTGAPGMLGMLGMHGGRAANDAVQACDLLIVIGARFDDRATGKLAEFAPGARVVHFDADASEVGKMRTADVAAVGDLKAALAALTLRMRGGPSLDIQPWVVDCARAAEAHAPRYDAPGERIYAPDLLKRLSEAAGDDFVAACDVGQHQMWAAQHCRFSRSESHISSGGLGAMGFGLPAGVGAKLARPQDTVVTIAGDGGFMMNIQELATLRRYAIPLKICLIDNSSLGLVRQWQELFFAGNYSEIDLSDNPDFVAVAEAFGIEAFRIERRDQVDGGIARLLAAEGPCLMHVIIDPRDNVWPLVPPGKCNADMMEGS
ncbi:acetolactate synthase 2 catalytic subunit [Brevundimonas sp. PAMC22021]|uniref:acetolactate synthase 2 catalytic subunit n=1 Tax=Brevundimonas sp. PAMC22021 TaxID=2861285 RepID=UPI001C6354B5|nr:acetolactate synthase 2 catalytic subunit [Brevundimonas sp. PAMC22021]QYF86012.1 acetolactate synthase 2 catalytic subunit [Brevundimonas sp. PAMC22021]